MATSEIALPKKTREQQWVVWDSARLNDFKFRPDDIMICTWSKSGTTWMQQIVAQLVLNGDPDAYGQALSPWPEFRLLPKERWFAMAEAQTHRRFIKTHSPLHAIPFRPDIKYIYVGRDVRDVVWSMYHHQSNFTPGAYQAFNSVPDRVGPPLQPPGCDVRAYYHSFIEKNATPGMMTDTEYWANVQEFWDIRNLPNVLLVHYANLKADFKGEVARIAKFLDIEVSDDLWPKIVENCSMEHMRKLGRKLETVSALFDGGIDTFINKGTNGRWKDVLSAEEIALADKAAAKNLTPDCAHWLKTGEMPKNRLPVKKREIVSAIFDSTRWNDFKFRDDDIIIDTWAKTGTTWMQQIVSQLVLGPDAPLAGDQESPWLDMRVLPGEAMLAGLEAQKHRRFIKSHLPLDALTFSPKAKYIHVGRDVRDVVWSLHNHSLSYTDFLLKAFNDPPGLPGQPVARPTLSAKDFYLRWLETGDFEGYAGFPSFWEHMQGWWDARDLPNVLHVHFANLKADLAGEMRRIARFLDIKIDEAQWPLLVEHCGFDYMKRASANIEQLGQTFKGGGQSFFNKGTNGQWKDVLSPEEIALADKVAAEHLTPDCAHWLKTGEMRGKGKSNMMKVIGAGYPRTGTASLKLALEQLGFGPCHHMREIFMNIAQVPLWVEAAKDPARADWDKVLEGYHSCTDAPGCTFWRELTDYYPDAKVILSVRDPEKWFESTQATVFSPEWQGGMQSGPFSEFFAAAVHKTFDGFIHDHDKMIAQFKRHIEEVMRAIPKERLLVFDVRDGWEPLCKFLGVPVPKTPFPATNSREEMRAMRAAAPAIGSIDPEQMQQMARARFGKQ